jgi:predicted MFS family arabinose efflux permease
MFGSLITRAALPFLAILVLHASAAQIAGLTLASILPGFLIGLVAGVGIDRLRRRPVMILADVGRALALGAIPILAVTGHLGLIALYAVAVVASALTVFFDVAEVSYIPSVVGAGQLGDANSRLAATQSVAEISAFGIAGWLVQWFTAPLAIAIDAVTFLVSGGLVATISSPEPSTTEPRQPARGVWNEMLAGLAALRHDRSLTTICLSVSAMECAYGIIGTVYALFALRELGFQPGLLGMIYAIGGVSSLAASVYAGRINRRIGMARVMGLGLALAAVGTLLLPIARGAGIVALLLLIGQQLVGDGGGTIAEINQTTLRQSLAPPALLGRINAGTRVATLGATLFGTALGGALGQTLGYRLTIVIGALVMLLGGIVVLRSPLVLGQRAAA